MFHPLCALCPGRVVCVVLCARASLFCWCLYAQPVSVTNTCTHSLGLGCLRGLMLLSWRFKNIRSLSCVYSCICCWFASATFVTKRSNSGNWCNSSNNSRKPQKAHSKTESRPTSAEQQQKNEGTRIRPPVAGNGKKDPTRTGAAETKQHTAPNSHECSRIKRMILHPHTRERSNKRRALTATTEAPGKPPAPEVLPGRRRQSRRHTNDTTPKIQHVPHREAMSYRSMHCPTTTGPSKTKELWMIEDVLWHHKRRVCHTTCKDGTEQRIAARTTVATGSPDNANGHDGASEQRGLPLLVLPPLVFGAYTPESLE